MAKAKNKKKTNLADKVHNKRKQDVSKKKLNPFEVHINKEKIKVLGKKSKHDKGLPGVSRAKAMQKRKETLGVEMKLMNKSNAFIDRRIGEKDGQLSAEDRMIARFAAERAKHHSRSNIYNLADDEVLTHRGQTLEQIEKFEDPRSDDEEDEGKGFGGLTDDFVSEGHFGGGILSKTESKDGAKSHKDLIEQLIAESKKRKAEKQKEKEQTLDLTEKLDTEWKDLQPVVFKKARIESDSIIDKVLSKAEKKGEDYDKMMRELRFEKRGTPSDGLKNDEKAAKEERQKLEQWERELKERMMMEAPVKTQQTTAKHRSAEDLDDNLELDDEKEFMLAYDKDGKPLVPENVLKDFSVPNAKPKFNDGVSDASSNDEDENDEESDDSDESENENETKQNDDVETKGNESILFQNPKHDSDSSSENDSNDENNDTSSMNKSAKRNKIVTDTKESKSEKEINKSNAQQKEKSNKSQEDSQKSNSINNEQSSDDEKNEEESSDDEENDQENIRNINKSQESHKTSQSSENEEESSNGDVENDKPTKVLNLNNFDDLKESESESESETEVNSDEETSFFDSKILEGSKLKELLSNKTPAEQTVALQKLIKSYDPSKGENNKDMLSKIFAHLLQYTNDIFTNVKDEGTLIKAFLTFDRLVPHFYDLAKLNKVSTKKYLVELLVEKRQKYLRMKKRIPDLDTLIFFKLISLLYPTSDFRHPVTTPSLIFMCEILAFSKFNNAYSIARGLFVTALILEYTVLSKRLVPAAINFLRGILYLSAQTSILNPIQLVPPFKANKNAMILKLECNRSKMEVECKMAVKDLVLPGLDDEFKIRSFYTSTVMLKEFFDNYNDLDAQSCIFEPHIKLLNKIDLELYPKKVKKMVSGILTEMKNTLEMKTYTPLCREKVRPKALRLYEPDIQEVFTGSKSSKLSREKAEQQRLKSKYKKEMKGALREIRRDKAYIASVKIDQKIKSDNIRKEKVKQIYKDASIQQGEINKLKRMK